MSDPAPAPAGSSARAADRLPAQGEANPYGLTGNDPAYAGVHPRLPWLDMFLLGAAGLLPPGKAGAFVRAGLCRSFTCRKVRVRYGDIRLSVASALFLRVASRVAILLNVRYYWHAHILVLIAQLA